MSAQIRHILDDANMDDEDIMRIMSIVEKQEEENEKLKEKLIQKIETHLSMQQQDLVAMKGMNKEIKKLEKENELLQENINEIMNDKNLLMVSDGLGDVVNVRNVMEQMSICRVVKEENEKLKEENKKCMEGLIG
jgi:hypothetical protein